MVYGAGSAESWAWLLGPVAVSAVTLAVARHSLARCDAELRRWYDRHHGAKVIT